MTARTRSPEAAAREAARKKLHFERNRKTINRQRGTRANQTNERTRARYARHRQKQFNKELAAASRAEPHAMSVVSADQVSHDRTRWLGPGWLREQRLEEQADEILRKHLGDQWKQLIAECNDLAAQAAETDTANAANQI